MSYELSAQEGAIAEFLGKGAAAGGPFAILGLKYDPIDESLILRACKSRLARINGHHRARTPAADEVRLAVHAAASQLLDPELCAELAKHWPEGSGELDSEGESPKAWRVEPRSRLDEQLKRQALTLLGACGGWNARSRKRLGQFARMHKVSAAQLVAGIIGDRDESVQSLDGSWNGGEIDRAAVRGPSLIDPSTGSLPWTLIPVVYVLMGLVLISVGYVKQRSAVDTKETLVAEDPGNSPKTTGSLFESTPRQQSTNLERRHYSAILHELELAQRDGVLNIDTGKRFSEVGGRLVDQWTEFPAEDLDRAVLATGGVLGGLLNSELFNEASSFLSTDDGNRSDSMLLLAMRLWLFGNESSNPELQSLMNRTQNIAREGSFDEALMAVFERQALLSSDDPAWWDWWAQQLEPLGHRGDPNEREAILLSAAYQRMVDPDVGDGWGMCARDVVVGIQWGSGSAGRAWIMGVVVDPKVESERLSIFTRAMAVHSTARGFGMDMIAGANDSMKEREAYLGRLRELWATDRAAVDDVRNQLIDRIELLLRMTRNPMGRGQAITRGVELARVNSACWVREDDEGLMIKIIESFDSPIESVQASNRALDLSSSAGDEQWATDARNIDDGDALLEHLNALDRFDSIGPKSAHALVYLAMQAPDLQVRAQAERSMLARPDEPAILIALDRIAGASRTTRRMVELINTYVDREGNLGDPASSRRALLGRLVQVGVLDDESQRGEIQQFSKALIDLVQVRGGNYGIGFREGESAYDKLVLELLAKGEDVPPEIRAKLLVRLRLSSGPMQRFAAYQSAALELFAHQISSENPALESRVRRVLAESDSKQRDTKDVVVQIMLIERALARLWLIVLESEVVS